jgi:hypothetical protein
LKSTTAEIEATSAVTEANDELEAIADEEAQNEQIVNISNIFIFF